MAGQARTQLDLVIVMGGNVALGLILISALRLLGLLRELDEWAQPGVRTS